MKTRITKLLTAALLIFLTLSLTTLNSCKKDPNGSNLSFNINSVSNATGGLKSVNVDCVDLPASYVKYKLNNDDFKIIPVFYVGGIPWTSSIKLESGNYTLNEFLVYNDNNTPNDLNDDILVSATPHEGSDYASYAKNGTLAKQFTVNTDLKTEIKIDVVCFVPSNFTNFGFAYFQMSEISVRQLWFYGDFCIKEKSDYSGSLYSQQTNWGSGTGFIDVPAIFKIEVWKNGVLQNTFSNSKQGEKLAITYGDYKNITESFEFKLFILVKQGNNFIYNYFKSWTFNDVSNISKGSDGVTDFVLGNCYDPSNMPDLILAPWMNLPLTATYKITANPSILGGYVDATLSSINPNGVYDLNNGVYPSNCADHLTAIVVGTSYNMDVYSSLYQEKLPLFVRGTRWNKINWLYNNLNRYPGYHWYDIQGFIWLYDNPVWNGNSGGIPPLTPLTLQMKADADTYGTNFTPLPGGWASIIFVPAGTPQNATNAQIQTMIIKIDP